MKSSSLLLAGSLVCASLGAVQAQAATFTERDSAYTITIPGALDTASTLYTVTAQMPVGGSSALSYPLNFKTGATGMTFSTSGGITTTFVPDNGAASETADIDNDGTGGTFQFDYTTPNGPNFTQNWTTTTVVNGHDVLAFGGIGSQGFGGCGSALLDNGGIFTCEVFITGNHPFGTAEGDIDITNLAAGYSPINWSYNTILGETVLTTAMSNYQGVNPSLGFDLIGAAAVPEPATWALCLLGVGMVGAGLRASRRRTELASAAL